MTSLLHTKKAFIDTYGEVPPMIGFLGIDTDGGAFAKTLNTVAGPVGLLPSEQYSSTMRTPEDTFRNNKSKFAWVPEGNSGALASLKGRGAGAKRSSGRFWLINQMNGNSGLEAQIRAALARITSSANNRDPRYTLLSDDVEVHLVFSLCGGTGAGTFIDMAYMLRRMVGARAKIAAYAVLPDVFVNQSPYGTENVKPNAYGCIMDLDYLMRLSPENEPIAVEYLDKSVEFKQRPVNAIFLIDNKNQNGDSFNNVDQLAEMISLALITAAGQLSDAAASTLDNIDVTINEANSRAGANIAWVSTMGASEIVVRSSILERIYAIKAARYLIDRLLHSDIDCSALANAWIDNPRVNIRENNGDENNNVIDFLMARDYEYPYEEIADPDNPMPEIQVYLKRAVPTADEQTRRRQEKTESVNNELSDFVRTNLSSDGGVAKTLETLKAIRYQVNDLFLKEMKDELNDLQKQDRRCEEDLKTDINEMQAASGFFTSRARKRDSRAAVVNTVNTWATVKREIMRHNGAISFFNGLLAELDRHIEVVEGIKSKLKAVDNDLENEAMRLQNLSSTTAEVNAFSIDLTGREALSVAINHDEVSVDEYLTGGGNSIEAFAALSQKEIGQRLTAFASKLKGAQRLSTLSVNDVLARINQQQPGSLTFIIDRALKGARPLLAFDDRGYPNEASTISDLCFIGVGDKDNNVISSELLMLRDGSAKPQVVSTGMKDRVIIYRQQGVAKAFMIGPLLTYETAYRKNPDTYHATMEIKSLLDREKWTLMPKAATDDAHEIWVRALVYGLVKREEGRYWYYNRAEGEALDDYMCELASDRVKAFSKFRKKLDAVRDSYQERFDDHNRQQSMEERKELRRDVKANYLERYSQLEVDRSALRDPINKELRDLLNKEIEFVNSLE